ncbi:MAG: HDOD domain-containing protein [Phycisphaerae bacterium]
MGMTTPHADTQALPGIGHTPTLPPHLQKAMARLTEIGSLPEITSRIVQVVEDPKSTANDMHDIVKNDPALAAKILKVVNSAFYGLPAQIASLDRAIVMLGLSAVKNIALAASLARFFQPSAMTGGFSARDLWAHSSAVGVCAKLLAGAAKIGQSDEAFVAGLVHDVGLVVELQLFPEQLALVVDRCLKTGESFCTIEQQLIGADHQTFGAVLAAKWKFPPGLRYAIGSHHSPGNLRSDTGRMAAIVYIADAICCQNQFGFYLTAQTQEVTDEMLGAVGLTEEQINEILVALPEQVKEAEKIFD